MKGLFEKILNLKKPRIEDTEHKNQIEKIQELQKEMGEIAMTNSLLADDMGPEESHELEENIKIKQKEINNLIKNN